MRENPITRPISELSADLRLGKLTSLDLVENALDRIATLDRKLESFVCLAEDARDQDDMVERACQIAFREGFAKTGQRVIVVAGVPLGTPGATNMIRVAFVGSQAAREG